MIVHVPESAWAKEVTKWEAQGSEMGPGLRPYVKRDWPSWIYLGGSLAAGGVGIVDAQCIDEHQYDRFRANGYRLTPLEALEVLTAQQTEFAKLAAEREWDKVHRLSPKAVAEVNVAEADAGAQHLPTITETPHGLRGVHVTSDRELALQAELDALKAQLADAMKPKRGGWPKGRSRPKKAVAVEA